MRGSAEVDDPGVLSAADEVIVLRLQKEDLIGQVRSPSPRCDVIAPLRPDVRVPVRMAPFRPFARSGVMPLSSLEAKPQALIGAGDIRS